MSPFALRSTTRDATIGRDTGVLSMVAPTGALASSVDFWTA